MKLPGNMQNMMKQAQQMQQKHAGGDRADPRRGIGRRRHGDRQDGRPQERALGVKIDPEVAGDVEMLQDMVMAAFNEAHKKVESRTQQKMGGMLGGLGLPPGMF